MNFTQQAACLVCWVGPAFPILFQLAGRCGWVSPCSMHGRACHCQLPARRAVRVGWQHAQAAGALYQLLGAVSKSKCSVVVLEILECCGGG